MSGKLETDKIIENYTIGSKKVNDFYEAGSQVKAQNSNHSTVEVDIDHYYNFYGVMSPEVTVRFLSTNKKWVDINQKSGSKINQNNFVVSATVEDTGFRTLNLVLFDRSFYSLQTLIFQAIKAGGGRDLTAGTSGLNAENNAGGTETKLSIENNGEEALSLDFVYQPSNTMANNLQIIWGYSEENPSNEATLRITNENYFKNINSESNARWNERKGKNSHVFKDESNSEDEIDSGSYSGIFGQSNQTTVRSAHEEFFITNVSTTLTNTGIQYNITAVSTDTFVLNGYKFLQMYATLRGTTKELLALFMKTFNESKNSLLKVIWTDTNEKPINGDEFIKNYDGKMIENNEENKNKTSNQLKEELSNLQTAQSLYINIMAVLSENSLNTIKEKYFNNQEIYYENMWSSENLTLGKDDLFSNIIAFFDQDNHGLKAFGLTAISTNDKDNLLKFVKAVSKYWNQISYGNVKSKTVKNASRKQMQKLLLFIIKSYFCSVTTDSNKFNTTMNSIQNNQKSREDVSALNTKLNNIADKYKTISNENFDFKDFKEVFVENDGSNIHNIAKAIAKKVDYTIMVGFPCLKFADAEKKYVYVQLNASGYLTQKIKNFTKEKSINSTVCTTLIEAINNVKTITSSNTSLYSTEESNLQTILDFIKAVKNYIDNEGENINAKLNVSNYDKFSKEFTYDEKNNDKNNGKNFTTILSDIDININKSLTNLTNLTENGNEQFSNSIETLGSTLGLQKDTEHTGITKKIDENEKKLENDEKFKNEVVLGRIDKYFAQQLNNFTLDSSKWNKLSSIKSSSGKTYTPTSFWNKAYEKVSSPEESIEDIQASCDEVLGNLEKDIKNIEEKISELKNDDTKLITLSLGGEEAKNNYSEAVRKESRIYYKSVSSLFSSFTSQCPPLVKTKVGDAVQQYKSINSNGEQVVTTLETQENIRRMQWTVIGVTKEGGKPIVGFRYAKPLKVSYLRVYSWGNGNAEQHCIKNLSIQNTSEFGMLNMALNIDKSSGTPTKFTSSGINASSTDFFSGDCAFANSVTTTPQEKNSIADKMINGIKKGTIEILGDPSLRFQDEYSPYCYPIKLDIKLQKDGSWSDNETGYVPCQLSGYYVITKITHNISLSGYTTTLEVMSYPGIDSLIRE